MSDISIYFPLLPTFEQINNLIESWCQNRLCKKRNMRLDVAHTLTELSTLSLYDIQTSYCYMKTNEFQNKIGYAYDKINKALINYIDNEILYIKYNKDSWVMEFYSFCNEYNKIVTICQTSNCTNSQKEEFVNYLSEFHAYMLKVFNAKYKRTFN